jgi:hypothetical protein
VGILLLTGRISAGAEPKTGGFTGDDEAAVTGLAGKLAPLVQKYSSEVAFSNLDDADDGDIVLKSMLSNFGRGTKRDFKALMRKKTRAMIMGRRLLGGGSTPEPQAVANEPAQEVSADHKEIVDNLSRWGMGVLKLEKDKMASMAEVAIIDLGLHETLHVSPVKFRNYALAVLDTYKDNPYHNHYHGFSVFQSCFWAIKKCQLVADCTSPLERLAMLTAALGHDAGHDGVNNAFHVKAYSDLSHLYNDKSPLGEKRTAPYTRVYAVRIAYSCGTGSKTVGL